MNINLSLTYTILALFIICATSCSSNKDVVYFKDVADFETIISENSYETKFKIDDLISIHVSTLDPLTSAPFNLYRGAQEGGIRPEQVDYLVDEKGEIDFPVLGKVKVIGKTPREVTEDLRKQLSDYLKNPIINIRLKNFTVTVLGEVNRPGTFPVEGEKISIMEALGYAGDVTIKGRKDNIQVLRDLNGTKVYHHLNLNSKEALDSPGYYLSQGDVVYVEPNKSGKRASVIDQQTGIIVSLISVVITSSVFIFAR